jgi:cation transport regulator ChaB
MAAFAAKLYNDAIDFVFDFQKLFMKTIKITIDGKTYHSVEEVPEEMRARYADMMQRAQAMAEGDRGPFSIEGPRLRFTVDGPDNESTHNFSFSTSSSFIKINDKTYDRVEDIPDDVRRANPDIVRNLTNATFGTGMESADLEKPLPTEDFEETADARRRIKASLKYHPLEKKTPVDTKNLMATLAGIIALLMVAILVMLVLHG